MKWYDFPITKPISRTLKYRSNKLNKELGIDKSDLGNYRAVLVIPALYKRPLIKHYMTLLLQKIGFGHAFVLQDHVAATFGAGLGKFEILSVFDCELSLERS